MKKFFTFLVILSILACSISLVIAQQKELHCSADGLHWSYRRCWVRALMFFVHQFTTMQCAFTIRRVFVKGTRLTRNTDEYQHIEKKFTKLNMNQTNDADDKYVKL